MTTYTLWGVLIFIGALAVVWFLWWEPDDKKRSTGAEPYQLPFTAFTPRMRAAAATGWAKKWFALHYEWLCMRAKVRGRKLVPSDPNADPQPIWTGHHSKARPMNSRAWRRWKKRQQPEPVPDDSDGGELVSN